MITLKKVSKFYYSKGVIASGFSKINLEFNLGEFVAITGESGSGKSTLLNVISGLDTYEEGEMYINGNETSHYTEKDFEDYRRKYIGNIFQNFNLVNSYTVYQNVELVLLLNGAKKKNIKNKVLTLIKKVGLYKFRNTKVSKLSGGQKQRVAIARALAKETPIIIADEPTGNLDSKASEEIIKLLSEVAKDKLVIIVTHNYEQVEKYITRKIKMHDGKVLEDKKIKEIKEEKKPKNLTYQNITNLNKIRLAVRNTFNIIPKFLLLFFIYLFITVAIIGEYAFFKDQEYVAEKFGSNYIFNNTSDKRIIIKKLDKTSFTEEDYNKIMAMENVDYVIKNDLLVDNSINLTNNETLWLDGISENIENFRGKIDVGRMPENDNEIIIEEDNYLKNLEEEILNKKLYLQNVYNGKINEEDALTIVGIKYIENTGNFNNKIYLSNTILDKISFQINQESSNLTFHFMDKYYNLYDNNLQISPSDKVSTGKAYISYDLSYLCPYQNCINKIMGIKVENLYYTENLELSVDKMYTKYTYKNLLELNNYDSANGTVFINTTDYNNLFNKNSYQSSVFIKDAKKLDETVEKLNKSGIKTLAIKNTLVQDGSAEIIKILRAIVTAILVIALFFISYFVISIILKSRNVYFSTIRMLGATKKICKQLLIIELLTISNLSYFLYLIALLLNHEKVFNLKFLDTATNYLTIRDFIILYLILTVMSYLISQKFAKKLFKKSAISSMKEEV